MLASLLLLAAAPQPATRQIELSAEDRYVVLSSLPQRLGGKFIVSGLANADLTCKRVRTCIAAESLASQAGDLPLAGAPGLLAATTIDGSRPVAIVSLVGARWEAEGRNLRLYAAVYDGAAARWTRKSAILTDLGGVAAFGVQQPTRKLRPWSKSSGGERFAPGTGKRTRTDGMRA